MTLPIPRPAMTDEYASAPSQLDSPAEFFYAITPSDSARLAQRPRAVRVGKAGDVVAVAPDNSVVVFAACYAGELLPIRPIQIKASGTTAGALVALV
ncbi:hypothetical protein AWB76_07890 [Caballeronia temeraria]|uniref:Uncharacterized protein n=1 Tax=Caballeronia temeraria TaxID=1777137 RepID=A0A158E5A0_9BURK|nr:hypothetical protein [Caballeronia temeraria]SAL01087.1 hypothetical protein AWB76_07890 [Caballeronia temeraria]